MTDALRAAVPDEALLVGPEVQWNHVDGPLMTWAGALHWLTGWEQLQLFLGWTTIDRIACKRWPRRAQIREFLQKKRASA